MAVVRYHAVVAADTAVVVAVLAAVVDDTLVVIVDVECEVAVAVELLMPFEANDDKMISITEERDEAAIKK